MRRLFPAGWITAIRCSAGLQDTLLRKLQSVQNATTRLITGTRRITYKLAVLGPDLQNILRQSYDYLTIIPKLRSTYDGRLIYKTSYEERKDFLRYDCKIVRSSKIVFVN